MNEMRAQVAAEVRGWGAKRGYSQTRVAQVLGCSQAAVSRKYRGEVPFDVEELLTLAAEYDVAITDLLPMGPRTRAFWAPASGVSRDLVAAA